MICLMIDSSFVIRHVFIIMYDIIPTRTVHLQYSFVCLCRHDQMIDHYIEQI